MNRMKKQFILIFCITVQLIGFKDCVDAGPHDPVQKVGVNFTGISNTNVPNIVFYPPFTSGSVGPKQIILATAVGIRSFDRKTGEQDEILDMDLAFFFNIEKFEGAQFPQTRFDSFSQRWFVQAQPTGRNPIGPFLLAISDGPIITRCSKWTIFVIPVTVLAPNAPANSSQILYQMGIDKKAVYLGTTVLDSTRKFINSNINVLPKQALLEGIADVTTFENVFPNVPGDITSFLTPADNYDKDPEFGYIIGQDPSSFDHIALFRVINPGSQHPSLAGPILMPVDPWLNVPNVPNKGNLFGQFGLLNVAQDNIFNTAHVRDNQLFTAQSVFVDKNGISTLESDRGGCRWFQFDLFGNKKDQKPNTQPTLVQTGTLFDTDQTTTTPKWYFMPAVMTNKSSDFTLSCTVAGANTFINLVSAGRKKSDKQGTLRNPIFLTHNDFPFNFGAFSSFTSTERNSAPWGPAAYTAPSPDPDGLDMWTFHQSVPSLNNWGVQVTQLLPKQEREQH